MNDKWFLGARRVFFALFACWVTLPAFATHRALVEETADAVKVGNGSVELIVPKGKAFNIQSMKLNDGEEMVVPSTNAIPWVLTYKGIQGENPMLFPEHGVYKGYEVIQNDTSASVVFVWDMRLSYEKRMYPIRMKVTATDHSELLYWDLTADLPKGWVISKAQFPRIAVVRPKDGKMITSAGWGNEFDMATGGAYKVTYPSCTGSMQLLLMHNGEGSFYYATEDRNACGKELRAVCGSKSVTFVTEVVTSEGWTDATTGRFDLPWTTVVGYNPDGWQAAALQWYRPHVSGEINHCSLAIYRSGCWIKICGYVRKVLPIPLWRLSIRRSTFSVKVSVYILTIGITILMIHIIPIISRLNRSLKE